MPTVVMLHRRCRAHEAPADTEGARHDVEAGSRDRDEGATEADDRDRDRGGGAAARGLTGKTPKQTLYGTLYAENKKTDGLVTRTAKGTFKLNPARRSAA